MKRNRQPNPTRQRRQSARTPAPTGRVLLAIPTPEGAFMAHYSTRGLARLEFPPPAYRPPAGQSSRPTAFCKKNDGGYSGPRRHWHRRTTAALRRTLAGKLPGPLPPLDFSAGTPFQQRVWQALRKIRAGQTRSYGELARALGQPAAARAVGGACGANPIPVLVPCHRVLAANRKIGGFSGGLNWKRTLLAGEGVTPG